MYKVQLFVKGHGQDQGQWATISWGSSFSIEWGIFERHARHAKRGKARFVANRSV